MDLTEKQAQVLAFVAQALAARGFPPTRAEIAEHFGWGSSNSADTHLQALKKKGVIELSRGTSRGIRIVPAVAA